MRRIKKLLIMLTLLTALMTALIISANAAELAYGAATVNATTLNIRSGPGTDYDRVTCVASDTKLVVLEKNDSGWYKVNYNGDEGYVDSTYLKDVLTKENFNANGTITADDVRVRSNTSTESDILATYDNGKSVKVIGINDGWYKVVSGDITGYIRSDLMSISGSKSRSTGEQIADYAQKFLGYRYVYGAESPSVGFDCSGLSYYVYKQFGVTLERRASMQYKNNGYKVSKSELHAGDLLFFSSNGSSVTHVGIYIGGDKFVHASTSDTGVIISDLTSAYYTRVWYGAKRIF